MNYLLFYESAEYLESGLMALVFSNILVMNMINAWIWFRHSVDSRMMVGVMIGMVGLSMVFWPEIRDFKSSGEALEGLVLAVAATYSASMGNMVSVHNQLSGISVMSANAYGMTYESLMMFVISNLLLKNGCLIGVHPI